MRLEAIEVFRVTRDARFHFVIERQVESRKFIRGRSSFVPRIDAHPTACAAGVNDDRVFEVGSLRRHSRDDDETASDEGVEQERHSRRIDAACSVSRSRAVVGRLHDAPIVSCLFSKVLA